MFLNYCFYIDTDNGMELQDAVNVILDHKRTKEEIESDMRLRMKLELIDSLQVNKNGKVEYSNGHLMGLEEYKEHIMNETPFGMEKVQDWMKNDLNMQ